MASHLTRRSALALASAPLLGLTLPRLALAAPATGEARFVLVILRGGMDGLGAVPAIGDPGYAAARGELAADPATVLRLSGDFALSPALGGWDALYRSGELAVVHAVASAYRERSHFDAQDLLEGGAAVPHGSDSGWLNRALAALPQPAGTDRRLGLALGTSIPLVLRGKQPVASWEPDRAPGSPPELIATLAKLYEGDPLLGPALRDGFRINARNAELLGEAAMGDAPRGDQAFATLAELGGKLLAAPDGARIAVLEIGGWDTHAGQGGGAARGSEPPAGRLPRALAQLAAGILALKTGLGEAWRDTVVVMATEFGRTVAANGTGGTDHGTASAMFLAGGAIKGGRVIANWPGLGKASLQDGRDLKPTLDQRAVFKAVLSQHLKLSDGALNTRVFPDSAGVKPMAGLLRA